jgi:hypothetical protein
MLILERCRWYDLGVVVLFHLNNIILEKVLKIWWGEYKSKHDVNILANEDEICCGMCRDVCVAMSACV